MTAPTIDAKAVRRAFSNAASRYDQHAVLQREVGQRLLERLDGLRFKPTRMIDLGCGTGTHSLALHLRFPDARLVALDLALPMLQAARRHQGWWKKRFEVVAADARALPLADSSQDLVYSSLMLQWCDDPVAVLSGLRRIMKPGGLLLLASFGPDTLTELRQSWAAVDDQVHVGHFGDAQGLGSALVRAGFSEPVLDTDWITTTYARPLDLMRELKGIGAANAAGHRHRGLTAPRRMSAMLEAYKSFRLDDGRYPATWEVVYASAWAPDEGQPIRTERGEEASVSVSGITIRRR